eukprot:4980421-Amphidinium_carterae.1
MIHRAFVGIWRISCFAGKLLASRRHVRACIGSLAVDVRCLQRISTSVDPDADVGKTPFPSKDLLHHVRCRFAKPPTPQNEIGQK